MDKDIIIIVRELARRVITENSGAWNPSLRLSVSERLTKPYSYQDYLSQNSFINNYEAPGQFADIHCRLREVAARLGGHLEYYSFTSECLHDSYLAQLFMVKCAELILKGYASKQNQEGAHRPSHGVWTYYADIAARLDLGKVIADCVTSVRPHTAGRYSSRAEQLCRREVELDLESVFEHIQHRDYLDQPFIGALTFGPNEQNAIRPSPTVVDTDEFVF